MKIVTYIAFLLCICSAASSAQGRLTIDDAIAHALKNNFDINIADLAAQQAERNNTLGNAGFAPYIYLNGSVTGSESNIYSELASGGVQSSPNGRSINLNPGVTVNWTLFDGGKMFLVKKQLNELQKIGEYQYRFQVQTMVSRTIQMYSQVVWQHRQLIAIDTALALARVRMNISDVKFQTGAGPKVDYLQARVDYNARQSDSLTQEANLTQSFDCKISHHFPARLHRALV